MEGSLASVAYRGRVSWVGSAGRESIKPDISMLMPRNASISGVFLGAEISANPARIRVMIEELLSRVATGELKAVTDRSFSLNEAAAAHSYIESRQAFGRVILVL